MESMVSKFIFSWTVQVAVLVGQAPISHRLVRIIASFWLAITYLPLQTCRSCILNLRCHVFLYLEQICSNSFRQSRSHSLKRNLALFCSSGEISHFTCLFAWMLSQTSQGSYCLPQWSLHYQCPTLPPSDRPYRKIPIVWVDQLSLFITPALKRQIPREQENLERAEKTTRTEKAEAKTWEPLFFRLVEGDEVTEGGSEGQCGRRKYRWVWKWDEEKARIEERSFHDDLQPRVAEGEDSAHWWDFGISNLQWNGENELSW